MPKRSRTHQLEDASINSFERLLPPEWVCRRKDKDYGVDLEVEIFDETGDATGLVFLVQMKATDDLKKERSVSMKVDRLEYLASFDTPSMVVRYCEASQAIHWIWLTNIFAKTDKPNTETVVVKFETSDKWSDSTPSEIVETAKVFRTIRTSSRRTPIGLSVAKEDCTEETIFELNYAVSQIRDTSRMVVAETDGLECLPVSVSLNGDRLNARIDVISSIGVRLKRLHRDEILAQLTYILAFMAGGYEFSAQAKNLAQVICDRRLVCQSRELAGSLACQFVDKPSLSAEIASLNLLHEQQDPIYAMYIRSLLSSELHAEEKSDAVKRFFTEALEAHKDQSSHRQSVIHYSFGNFYRMTGDQLEAVKQYNFARKKNPEYFVKDYFLAELAATLYFRRRFRTAAKLYAASFELSKLPRTAICAGDAFLFSGDFQKSSEYFELAVTSKDEFENAEASLKIWLSEWCSEHLVVDRRVEAGSLSRRVADWTNIFEQSVKDELYIDAVGASLMLAYMLENDEKTWTQAISAALNSNDAQLLIATFSSAIWRCGYDAYTPFRDHLTRHGFDNEMIFQMDSIVKHLQDLRESTGDDGVTMRFIEQHHFDVSDRKSREIED